jgi:DNA-binding CsgD family transcriptional regulator
MTIKSGALNKASLEARRWAARLCLAEDDAEMNEVLGAALLDMGFDVIDAVQKRPEGGVDLCWSSQGGELVSSDDPFVNARGEVLSRLDPDVHRWIARQDRIVSQEDFLALDTRVYTEFLHLPRDFGLNTLRTKLSLPFRRDRRGFSIGMASSAPFDLHHARLGDIRFLTNLYCTLRGEEMTEEPESPDEVELNPKQLECLRWAAAGKSYQDIAMIVGITERTVRYHLNSARDRYGFSTIMQTIVQAAKQMDLDPTDAR